MSFLLLAAFVKKIYTVVEEIARLSYTFSGLDFVHLHQFFLF
jgi:hypothetical protein